jgi:PAS domain S-box-containing protein
MNHISSKWLKKLRWLFLLYAAHFVIIYLYIGLRYHEWGGTKTFPAVVVILVALQFVYEIYASLQLLKRSAFIATSVTLLLVTIETGIVFNPTGVYYSPYIAAFFILAFLGGALGWVWPALETVLLFVLYLFGLAGFLTSPVSITKAFKLAGLAEIIGIAVVSLVGYLFWRPRYDLSENTQLSQLDQLLKNRQQQSLIIIESIGDGVIVFDTKGAISLINPAAAALTGWTVKDASGMDIHAVVKLASLVNSSPSSGETDIFANVLVKKQRVNEKLRLSGQNNQQTIVSLSVSPVVVPPKNEVVGGVAVLRDVTKEQQVEQQRSDFISTASHEMRTPVAAIEGYLDLALNNKVSNVDSKAREYLEKAHQSTEHLGKLFQDLLTSAKAEDGRLTNHPSLVELGAYVEQLSQDLRFAAQKKSLGMEFVLGTGNDEVVDASQGYTAGPRVIRPLYYVYVDPDRLREVITNLFDNAVKYTDEGKISLGLTGDPNIVQLSVRDTGPGIPADDVPHLFQKFYRVDNSATRTVGGTGLGLFICRKIIELYGGRIWVESKLGQGSTFFINLPRLSAQRAEQLKSAQTTAQPLTSSAMATS